SPSADVEHVLGEEARSKEVCATQAEVKRQATLMLSHSSYVMLRESVPPAAQLRLQASVERGLGMLLKLGRVSATQAPLQAQIPVWEAALLPLRQSEAQRLCETILGLD